MRPGTDDEMLQIYKKCFSLMDTYFPEDDAEDTGIGGAQVDSQGAFAFQTDLAAPQGGFSFVRLSSLSSLAVTDAVARPQSNMNA